MPLGLLAYERGRAGGGRRPLVLAAGCGLVAAWLQPWQGATLILVLVGAELLSLRRGRAAAPRRGADLALPVAATAAPLVYYWVLSRSDASWELAGVVNDFPRWPWWVTVLGLLAAGSSRRLRLPAAGARLRLRSRCASGRSPGSRSSTSPPAPSRSTPSRA